MTRVEEIAAGLTKAQRDTMLGHMVEIPPHEADALVEQGLKDEPFEQVETYTRTVWPITRLGIDVRKYIMEQEG